MLLPAQKGPPLWPIMQFRVMMGFLRSTHRRKSPLSGEKTGPVGGERAHPPVRARGFTLSDNRHLVWEHRSTSFSAI